LRHLWCGRIQKIERELDSKNEAFREAVVNMEIRVHMALQELVIDFSDVDGLAYVPTQSATDAPSVNRLLGSPEYRRQLPDWARPLVDSRLDISGAT
jgi:hypothetical protein